MKTRRPTEILTECLADATTQPRKARGVDRSLWGVGKPTKRETRDKRLQATYGLGKGAYDDLYRIQDGRCAICGRAKETLAVDHCHETERVRGLLCSVCNSYLGLIREDPMAARRLLAYIENRCIPSKLAGPLFKKSDPLVSQVTKSA